MDKNQTQGVLERLLYGAAVALVGIGVKRGWYDSETATYLAGGLVAAAGSVWAFWINRPKALASAAATDGVKVIVPDQKMADSIANPNVMGPADAAVVKK